MRTLYFDCASGISGNMVLGALVEILGDKKPLLEGIEKLHMDGYDLKISKKDSYGITGTYVEVVVDGKDEMGHTHHIEHHHGQEQNHNAKHHGEHRNLKDIQQIIERSDLAPEVQNLAKGIFQVMAEAEAKVHGKALDQVHFHEVGAIDSIIDIVGTAILLHAIGAERILVSTLQEGTGFIDCAHGRMAVPVPATTRILTDHHVPFRQIEVNTEMVTPTGAAIAAAIADAYGLMPEMRPERVGFGLGSRDVGFANALKVYLGETTQEDVEDTKEEMFVLETNIDDSTGEELGYALECLMEAGALDAYATPIFMKKQRPAYQISVICRAKDLEALAEVLFRETTTIGVRYYPIMRKELSRELVCKETSYGEIRCKRVKTLEGNVYDYPEYEDLRRIAKEKGISLREIKKEL